MVGLILWHIPEGRKRQKRLVLEEKRILHMRFACARITKESRTPDLVLRRRVSAAAKRLRKLGVSQVVLPEEFPYGELLAKYGIRPASTLALRREIAADAVRNAMEEHGLSSGSAKLAVTANLLTGELVRLVTELSLRNRYVLLDLPYGGEELCRQLRREYGVSLLLGPEKEQLEGADVLVQFDARPDLSGKNPVVLPLYEGAETAMPCLTLPPVLEEQIPEGCDRAQLFAVLRDAGALRPGQIGVGRAALPA